MQDWQIPERQAEAIGISCRCKQSRTLSVGAASNARPWYIKAVIGSSTVENVVLDTVHYFAHAADIGGANAKLSHR